MGEQARAILKQDKMSKEDESRFDAIMADVDRLGAQIAREEKLDALESEMSERVDIRAARENKSPDEVREDQQKARTAYAQTGLPALGDDSGLEAAALGGAPGVRSARFAGEDASDADNVALLLARAPAGSALAFVCALAYVDGDQEMVVHGRCTGRHAAAPRGAGGFGYDPVFIAGDDPAGRTMAELSAAEKAAISHRGRAARALAQRLG